jgi:hypothetical protein
MDISFAEPEIIAAPSRASEPRPASGTPAAPAGRASMPTPLEAALSQSRGVEELEIDVDEAELEAESTEEAEARETEARAREAREAEARIVAAREAEARETRARAEREAAERAQREAHEVAARAAAERVATERGAEPSRAVDAPQRIEAPPVIAKVPIARVVRRPDTSPPTFRSLMQRTLALRPAPDDER